MKPINKNKIADFCHLPFKFAIISWHISKMTKYDTDLGISEIETNRRFIKEVIGYKNDRDWF